MVPDEYLLRGMFEVAEHGGLCVIHAENYGVVTEMVRRYLELGRTNMKVFTERYPSSAEGAAVELAMAMTEIAGTRSLIFHNTCIEGVEAIRKAKARGVEAYGELGIGWGVFNADIYQGDPVKALPFLLTPPVRGKAHQDRLWRGLAQGDLDIVSTDHTAMWLAPRERALELAESFGIHIPDEDIKPVAVDEDGVELLPLLPPGGVEVRLPLVYHYAVNGGIFDVHRWVEVCCSNPARIFDLHQKGQLLPGYDADIVVFDPDKEVTITVDDLHSNTNYSVFEDMTIRGAVEKTFSRGTLLVDGGAFVGPQDHGQFIERRV
jgi:dihydropyrimidinase